MTLTNSTLYGIVAVLILAVVYLMGSQVPQVYASAPAGLPARIATSSSPVLAATTATVIIATSSCSARMITTKASPILLTFSDLAGLAPTATYGHLQAASTTVVYDSGQYGCGLVKAYAMVADTITVSESN